LWITLTPSAPRVFDCSHFDVSGILETWKSATVGYEGFILTF
jgi:hypothetical protein